MDPQKMAEQTSSGEVYQNHHRILRETAGGGLLGLAAGSLAGEAGTGAAIGAGVGALVNVVRSRRDIEMQHEVTENAPAQQSKQLKQYDRAYCTCLQGRGYTTSY